GAGVRVRRTGAPRRLLGVRRAGGAGPRAALGEVALARRGSAHGAPVPRRVLAGHVGAVALIQGAGVGVGRAGDAGRLLDVRRAGGGDAATGLRQIALARRRTADRARRHRGGGRTGRARAGAALGQVALARRRAAHRAPVPRRVRAGVGATVAPVEGARVGVGRARGPGRLLGVGRTGGAGAGAALGDVALARGRAAHRARVPGRMRARRARTVAHVGGAHVAVVRAGRAARLEDVGRAGGAGAGAALGQVALARRRAADRARGLEGVGR